MGQPSHEAPPGFSEVVRTIALAWRNVAAYPSGHPMRTGAITAAQQQLLELTASHGRIVIGVARNGLVLGDTTLQSEHANQLARALYARQVALLRIDPGVQPEEVEALLRLLAQANPRGDDHAVPVWEQLTEAGALHIHLDPVDYSDVRITDRVEPSQPSDPGGDPGSLWEALLRALMASRQGPGGPDTTGGGFAAAMRERGAPVESPPVTELMAWLSNLLRAREAAGHAISDPGDPGAGMTATGGGPGPGSSGAAEELGPSVPGTLAPAVGAHLTVTRGGTRQRAARQVVDLARALPLRIGEAVLEEAVRALASDEGGGEALETLSAGAPDLVLMTCRRLRAEGAKLSGQALLLARSLGSSPGSSAARSPAGALPLKAAFLAELVALFRDEDIDRYNPDEHQTLLEHISINVPALAILPEGSPADLGDRIDSLEDRALAQQLAQTLIEMLVRHGSPEASEPLLAQLGSLFRFFLTAAHLEAAGAIIDSLRRVSESCSAETRSALLERIRLMGSPETLAVLADSIVDLSEPTVAALRGLMDRLGPTAVDGLLRALVEEPSRPRRRRFLNLLGALGPAIVTTATAWLADSRWYVVRNMIVLLRSVGDRSSLPRIRLYASHADPRVRLEALKSLYAFDDHVPRDILTRAINDPDRQVAEAAVEFAATSGRPDAVAPLVRMLTQWDPRGRRRSIRLHAWRVLGRLADPTVLPQLQRFFRNWVVPVVAIEEQRAAFQSLAAYPESARRSWVAKGLRSRDPKIRDICRRLVAPEAAEGAPGRPPVSDD